MPGSLLILVTLFFVFWLSRMTKIIFYVCLLTHFARQDRQNGNLKNKQNHATKVTKLRKKKSCENDMSQTHDSALKIRIKKRRRKEGRKEREKVRMNDNYLCIVH